MLSRACVPVRVECTQQRVRSARVHARHAAGMSALPKDAEDYGMVKAHHYAERRRLAGSVGLPLPGQSE